MDNEEKIEQFILGRLSGDALAAFEAQMKEDPALAGEVNRQQALIQAIRLAPALEDFRSKLANMEAQANTLTTGHPLRRVSFAGRWAWATAAIFLLALSAWLYWQRQQAPASPEALFASAFHPPATLNRTIVRGNTDTVSGMTAPAFSDTWNTAVEAYNQGRFDEAFDGFQKLRNSPQSADFAGELAYCFGLTCLQTGAYEQAAEAFVQAGSYASSEAPWYHALTLLALGRHTEAYTALEEIARSTSPFSNEASTLLEKLGKPTR